MSLPEGPTRAAYDTEGADVRAKDLLHTIDQEASVLDTLEFDDLIPEPTEEQLAQADTLATRIETESATNILTAEDEASASIEPLDLYLSEVRRIRLLEPAEKTFHMGRFLRGKEARTQMKTIKGSSERAKNIREQIQEGLESRTILIQAHLPWVIHIAKKYRYRNVPFTDLINAGNIGLIRALHKYRPSKKTALSTYATFWIQQAVLKEISDSSRTIRMPEHAEDDTQRMLHMITTFMTKRGSMPSDSEIAQALHLRVIRIRELREGLKQPISTETPVKAEADEVIGDYLADQDPATEQHADTNMLRLTFNEVFETLTKQEQSALRLLYSSPSLKLLSIEDVATQMRLPADSVRTILQSAKTKIVHHPKAELLHEYVQ